MDTAALAALPVDEVVAAVGVARAIGLKHVASLLFTYRCTIACDHCLFNCSPSLPNVVCSLDDSVEYLRQLRATDRVVHIAGGEAMMYWEQLLSVCRAAATAGVAPHFIESNASWAKSDQVVRERYAALRDCGVAGILLSADPYHQAFVKPGPRRRAYDLAVEAFGAANVAASDASEAELGELAAIARDPARLAEHARTHPPNLTGRAAEALGQHFPDRPLETLAGDRLWHGAPPGRDCRTEFDPHSMWELHIDPYGHIQTCCGIILGQARTTPLPELLAADFATSSELVHLVRADGPFGLLAKAEQLGYAPLAGYKQKCHLCWELRKFLRPWYPEALGPDEIYGPRAA